MGFTKYLLEYMASTLHLPVDPSRVYATGMSNGGFMANRIGCELSSVVAAIAPVSGPLMENPSIAWRSDPFSCETTRPVPVLHFHGLADIVVPYNGNRALSFPSVAESIAGWTARNGIPPESTPTTTYHKGDVTCESLGDSRTNVTLCSIIGAGHSWPGAPGAFCPDSGIFACTKDIDASREIWNFFKQHTL